ncbi:MAG: hypothetical protein EOO62_03305 [Hymenobacter sp.]|nr:MAG: hypothetical protein EOO62_03305 [Hymenobacter sp.]
MNQSSSPVSLGVAFRHWWLHVWTGALLYAIPFAASSIMDWTDRMGGHLLPGGWQVWLVCCSGAAVVGLLRLPVLWGFFRLAHRQRWPLAALLLASAVLFLAPILLLLPVGSFVATIGLVSLTLSLPFLGTYVLATYWLRQSIYGLPQPTAK